MRDHLMGYGPAAREDFEAPCWWEQPNPYPLGVPVRVRDTWGDCEAVNQCRQPAHVTAASSQCMTKGDVVGLQAAEQPQPEGLTPEDVDDGPMPCMADDVPRETAQGVYTPPEVRTLELRTLSPAAEWPFAESGFSNRHVVNGQDISPPLTPAAMLRAMQGLGEARQQHAMWHEQRRLELVKEAEHRRWLDAEAKRKAAGTLLAAPWSTPT